MGSYFDFVLRLAVFVYHLKECFLSEESWVINTLNCYNCKKQPLWKRFTAQPKKVLV